MGEEVALALTVEHPDAVHLAHELADRTGESVDEAVVNALRQRLAREPEGPRHARPKGAVRAIWEECRRMPDLDERSADEILGYDEHGLPT
jgi:antitoxin VapB